MKLLSQKSRTRTARLIALGVIEKCHPSGTAEMLVLRIVSARDSRMVQGAVSKVCQTNFKFWELLMTNTRMFILFAALFIAQPVWYFWIEVTVRNILLGWLIYRQEEMSQSLLELAATMR